MLAPIDKVTRPGGNRILQIEVTRKCNLHCSNCTRALDYRHDTLQMSLDVFRTAVESVKEWPGIVALFGGNPVSHSRFPELCRILSEYIPPQRRGLWTNNLLRNGKIAAETFSLGVLNLNAHADAEAYAEMDRWFPGRVIKGSDRNPSWHSAILVDYRDLGIPESEWIQKREACDVNQNWSGIIQEFEGKAYGYFCEIAGTIDALTGQRNGVEVYPGWWRQHMPTFQHQVKNCCDRGCAVPLRLKGHLDRDDTYDVSPSWLPLLQKSSGKVSMVVHEKTPEQCRETTDYARLRT